MLPLGVDYGDNSVEYAWFKQKGNRGVMNLNKQLR